MRAKFISLILIILSSAIILEADGAVLPSQDYGGQVLYLTNRFSKRMCVYPQETNNGYYASLDYENSDNCNKAPKFIFDVLGRVSTMINSKWWCLTSPSSSSIISSFDYIQLKPCSISDPYQQWLYTDKTLTARETKNTAREINWSLAVSNKTDQTFEVKWNLNNPSEWINSVSIPKGGLAFDLPLYWQEDTGNTKYYIGGGNTLYDPESKHIYKLYKPGSWLCLESLKVKNQSKKWDWTTWTDCGSGSTSRSLEWNIQPVKLADEITEAVLISDADSNYLRVTRNGSNWGNPYTIDSENLKTDTSNKPFSAFMTDKHFREFYEYRMSNYGQTLNSCPARGSDAFTPKTLPPSFQLTEAWIRRLYSIFMQPGNDDDIGPGSGEACGRCMMQALEMASELLNNPMQPPAPENRRGQLFPIDRFTDIFLYLQQHDAERMRLARRYYSETYHNLMPTLNAPGDWIRASGVFNAELIRLFIPNVLVSSISTSYASDGTALSDTSLNLIFANLVRLPVNSVLISVFHQERTDGSVLAHAIVMLRQGNGLVILPTAGLGDETLDEYRSDIRNVITSGSALRQGLQNSTGTPNLPLSYFSAHHLTPFHTPPLSVILSQRDCNDTQPPSGLLGAAGYGNRRDVRSNEVNQCGNFGGRCDQSHPHSSRMKRSLFNEHEHLASETTKSICQWLSLDNGTWVWKDMPDIPTEQACKDQDNCNKGGACYRWTQKQFMQQGELGSPPPPKSQHRMDIGYCENLVYLPNRWEWVDVTRAPQAVCQNLNKCAIGGACYRWKWNISADDSPGSDNALTGICQYLKYVDAGWGWVRYDKLADRKSCESANRCNQAGGSCFRWTISP